MKFYGQFNPPVDKFIFERYFPDANIQGFFVECGAFDGHVESSCKFFEESCGWKGINIEPAPPVFERLVANRPGSLNFNLALSSAIGTAMFRHAISPTLGQFFGNGSLSHAEAHLRDLEERGCSFENYQVSTTTWSKLMEQVGVGEVDLFVLDVEGHELDVIAGMHGSSVLPKVMCVEFGHLGFSVVRAALNDLGYEYDIHSAANAYFIRRDVLPLFAFRRATLAVGVQDLAHETDVVNHAERIAELGRQVEALDRHIGTLEGSLSWRVTAPLRWLRRLLG